MLKNTKLVSDKNLINYLHGVIANYGNVLASDVSLTAYCDNMGQGLTYEGAAGFDLEGMYNLGTYTFSNEFAPYTKDAIARMVKFQREGARD